MKLKAILEDPRVLSDMVDLCRSTQQTCTLCLQAGTIRVFSAAEAGDAVQVWAECRTTAVFREFRCESPYNNALVCDLLDTRHLCHVLKSAEKLGKGEGYERHMRLSKNDAGPLLKLLFRSQHGTSKSERYMLPIRLRSQQEVEALRVPALSEEESLHIVIPNIAELSHFIENARAARCELVTLHAKEIPAAARKAPRGHPALFAALDVEAAHSYARQHLHYPCVQRVPPPEREEEGCEDSVEVRSECSVCVPLRKLAPFVAVVRALEPGQVSAILVHETALVLCFSHARSTSVAAYIPAVVQQTFS